MANEKWSGSNPWLGLAPYTEGTPLYGRTHESAVLSEIIKANIATIVYGKSGIGKSSLLSAGISPMLRNEHYIPVPLRLVHNTDVSYVEQIESRVRELVECKDELSENVPDLGLWDFFHRHTFTKDGIVCQPVIILDQFEEIYTLTDVEHKPDIITLFTELASLLNDIKPDAVLAAESSFSGGTTASASSGDDFSFELSTESSFAYNETVSFRFVICLREDKLYLLERNSANIPSIKTNRYNLQALSPDSALEVIMCPRPDLFTKEEATAIVDKLADMGDEGIRTVDPAILSLFLYKYFEKKGEANYDNIFADYYREATKGVKDKSLAFLEDHLLTLGGYRNQIPVDDALSSGVSQSEIDSLLKQIILRSEKRKGIDYIEFSHDRLCAEAKINREARSNRLQRQIMLRRIVWGVSALGLIVLLGALYVIDTQKTNEILLSQRNDIETQKVHIDNQLQQLKYTNQLLSIREKEKDSVNILLMLQRDSLNTQNSAIGRINKLLLASHDSLSRMNEKQKLTIIALEKAEKDANILREQAENQAARIIELSQEREKANAQMLNESSIMTEDTSVEKIYNFFVSIREIAKDKQYTKLSSFAEEFEKYNLSVFSALRMISGDITSLNGHFIFNKDFLQLCSKGVLYTNADQCNRKTNLLGRGQISTNSILYKNFGLKANSSLVFSFSARGHEEIGIVTEPGGAISLKVHVTNSQGLDEWFNTTRNFVEGEPYRKLTFDMPSDVRNTVEVEIINCKNKDVSLVVISN